MRAKLKTKGFGSKRKSRTSVTARQQETRTFGVKLLGLDSDLSTDILAQRIKVLVIL